jgi:hypothetical protein
MPSLGQAFKPGGVVPRGLLYSLKHPFVTGGALGSVSGSGIGALSSWHAGEDVGEGAMRGGLLGGLGGAASLGGGLTAAKKIAKPQFNKIERALGSVAKGDLDFAAYSKLPTGMDLVDYAMEHGDDAARNVVKRLEDIAPSGSQLADDARVLGGTDADRTLDTLAAVLSRKQGPTVTGARTWPWHALAGLGGVTTASIPLVAGDRERLNRWSAAVQDKARLARDTVTNTFGQQA